MGGDEGQWQQWPMLTVFYRGIRWKNQKSNQTFVRAMRFSVGAYTEKI